MNVDTGRWGGGLIIYLFGAQYYSDAIQEGAPPYSIPRSSQADRVLRQAQASCLGKQRES